MDLLAVAVAAAVASALTLFSGFGLGTILLPVFALFLPVPLAVAATGIVHLFNNLFKGVLVGRRADWPTVLRFGLPAVPAAIAGAWLLAELGETERLFEWSAWGRSFGPTGAGVAVGLLMILLAVLELQRWFGELKAPPRWMPLGGLASGFLGGLTGQQGALRSIFLLRAGLSAERFIATGVMVAILVDLSRLGAYWAAFRGAGLNPEGREGAMVVAGMLAAFSGAWLAARYSKKMTITAIRYSVAALMLLIGAALATGLTG